MKVKDIVNNLNKFYSPDDDLIVMWWDREWFENCYDTNEYTLTDDDVTLICDEAYDDESVGEQISNYVNELVSDRINTIEQDEKHLEAQAEQEQQEQELWDTDETNA